MNHEEFAEAYGFLPAVSVDNLVFLSSVIGIKGDASVPTYPEEQHRQAAAFFGEGKISEVIS